ncbi:MAG: hypothetical protein ACOC5T_02420 [Elusimicrobiota bacterium]
MTNSEWKVGTSLYLPVKILKKVKKEAKKKQISTSKVVSIILAKHYKKKGSREIEKPKGKIITCSKCGAEYSSKLEKCPTCAMEEVKKEKKREKKKEKEKKEKELKDAKVNLEKELVKLDKLREHKKKGQATEKRVKDQKEKVQSIKKNIKKIKNEIKAYEEE